MSLATVCQKLRVRIRIIDHVFDRHVLSTIRKQRADRYAFQEGLVSSLWQIWSSFCRSILIASATGAVGSSGTQISSPYSQLMEPQVTYVLRQLAARRSINVGPVLLGMYQEPTWGDLDKLNLMAVGLNATNSSVLASAFSCGLVLRDLQLCRNASAHLNRESMGQILSARVRYSQADFSHPSDLMLWVDPSSKDYVWKSWIEEIDIIAELASY